MGCTSSKEQEDSSGSEFNNRNIDIPAPVTTSNPQNNMFLVAENGLIGEGGFGRVMAALLVANKNWYAVKEINKAELIKHRSGLNMLHGEMEAHKRMDHAFIVSLHMTFQDVNNCYIVLDLKTGGDLRYYLRKKLLFEERDVAFYVACISSALDHIHSKNVIHRDIKPENIILDERGFPHLTDFGVAHVQSPDADIFLTSNLASGTKQYLAPEVFTRAHVHGPESDFWALAVVAYELLYGKRPFEKHCNVQFINYLERGLSLKRKQLKEMKIRELASNASNSGSGTDPDCRASASANSSATASPCPSPVQRTFVVSPSASQTPPLSPCQSKDGGQVFFPAIKSGSSMDSYDQPTFCSSVGYTPGPTMSGSRKGVAKGIAASSRDSSKCSVACTDELEMSLDGSGHGNSKPLASKSCSLLPQLPSNSPQRTGGSTLPPCASPPRLKGNKLGGIAASGTKQPQVQPKDSSNCTTEEGSAEGGSGSKESLSSDEEANATAMRRLRAGDHWVVDDDYLLPHDLRVHIPVNNVWLGRMSSACVSFLRHMFDIRPSHRLSSRDIDAIRLHPWLVQNDVSNWNNLQQYKFSPAFKPGKRFMRDTFDDFSNAVLLGEQLHENGIPMLLDSPPLEEPEIPAEQNELFEFFDYASPTFDEFFADKQPCLRNVLDFPSYGRLQYTLQPEASDQQLNNISLPVTGPQSTEQRSQRKQQKQQSHKRYPAADKKEVQAVNDK